MSRRQKAAAAGSTAGGYGGYYGHSSAAGASTNAPPAAAAAPAPAPYYGNGGGYGAYSGTAAAPQPAPAAAPAQEDWYAGGAAAVPAAPSQAPGPSYYGAPAPAPAASVPAVSSSPFGYSGGGGTSTSAKPASAPNGPMHGGATNGAIGGQQQPQQNLPYGGSMFNPTDALSGAIGGGGGAGTEMSNNGGVSGYKYEDYDNEPPLLEELGINMRHIATKSRAVVLPFSRYNNTHIDQSLMGDADLAGPLVFALALAGELLLSGKVAFGYIYGFGLFGCVALCFVLNLMSPGGAISVWTVTSILGYALLPVNALAGINILYRLHRLRAFGMVLSAVVIIWCSVASTRLFEIGCGFRDQRYLVAYPIALIYSAFVIITIF